MAGAAGARAFRFLWCSAVKSSTHVGIHLHSEASANSGWTRGSDQEREEKEKREAVEESEEKLLPQGFCICSLQAAEVVSQSAIY